MSDRPGEEHPTRAPKRKQPRPAPPGLAIPALLRKFVELSILAALIGAVITVPPELPARFQVRMATAIADMNGGTMPSITDTNIAAYASDLLHLFHPSLPDWELRVAVFAILALFGVGAHVLAKLYEALCHRPVFEDPSRAPRQKRNRWRRRLFLFSIIGLLGHAFLSYFFGGWVAYLPPISGFGSEIDRLATARMPAALEGALLLSLAFAWYLAAEDAVRSRRFVYSFMGLTILVGVIAAVIAIIVQRPSGPELLAGSLGTAPLGAPSTWLPVLLIPPLLLSWTVLCIGPGGMSSWHRVLLALASAVILLALLEWADLPCLLLALGAFVLLVWLLRRRAGTEFSMSTVVGIPLVAGALMASMVLTGDPPRAFQLGEFIQGDASADIQPVRLGVQDRLRVLFVSIPMILQNPIEGSGWGSFAYVFPEARARFFQMHPDSILAPAPFGLTHARSDLVQLLFEAGLLGAVLVIGGAYLLLTSGWASLRGCVRQDHVTLQLGIFVSILALLAFALIESAFRIPLVAGTLLVMMAVWGNGERLWRLEVPRLEERVVGLADLPPEDLPPPPVNTGSRRPTGLGFVAWSFATVIVAAAVAWLGGLGGQWFSGRLLLAQGSMYIAQAASAQDSNRMDYLFAANGALDLARRLQPQAGDIHFESARLQLAFAREKLRQADAPEAGEELATNPPDVLRRLALNDARQGLMLLDEASLTLRGKDQFHVRAMLHDVIARTDPAEADEASREALRSLGQAVRLNPGDSRPVVRLLAWVRASDFPTEQNVRDLYDFLYRYHPAEFRTHVLDYVDRLHQYCDDAEAYREARRIHSLNPTDPALRLIRARAAFYSGDLTTANQEAASLRAEGVTEAVMLDAMIAARESAYGRAMADARLVQAQTTDPRLTQRIEVFMAVLRARMMPTAEDRRTALNNLRTEVAGDIARSADLAHLLASVFQDHATARSIMRQVTSQPEAANQARLWALLSDTLVRSDSNAITLLRQLDRQPLGPSPAWERLRPTTARARIAEAIRHLDTATEAAESDEIRQILRQRRRRLEVLLPPEERGING
jgi:hypothetical protein